MRCFLVFCNLGFWCRFDTAGVQIPLFGFGLFVDSVVRIRQDPSLRFFCYGNPGGFERRKNYLIGDCCRFFWRCVHPYHHALFQG